MSDTTGSDHGSNADPTTSWLRLIEAIEAKKIPLKAAEELAMKLLLTNWENAALAAQVNLEINNAAVQHRIRDYTADKLIESWNDILWAKDTALDLDFQVLKSRVLSWTENHPIETEEDLEAAEELYSTSGFEHLLGPIEEYHRRQILLESQDASLPEIPDIADSTIEVDAVIDPAEPSIDAGDVSPFGEDDSLENKIPTSFFGDRSKPTNSFANHPPLLRFAITSKQNPEIHIPQHALLDPAEIYAALKSIFDNNLPGTGSPEQAQQLQDALNKLPSEKAADFFAYLNAIRTKPAIENASQTAVLLALANHPDNKVNVALNNTIRIVLSY